VQQSGNGLILVVTMLQDQYADGHQTRDRWHVRAFAALAPMGMAGEYQGVVARIGQMLFTQWMLCSSVLSFV